MPRPQRGSALVELALLSTVLLLLLFGLLDFGRLFHLADVATGAARAGTQFAMQSAPHQTDDAGIIAAAQADARPTPLQVTISRFCTCEAGGSLVSCTTTCTGAAPAAYVQVDTTIPFTTLMEYPLLAHAMPVTGRSVIRVQ